MKHGPHDTPSSVCAEEGEVHIDGPGGTALAMTPQAALDTADRLTDSAALAMGQIRMRVIRDGEVDRLRDLR